MINLILIMGMLAGMLETFAGKLPGCLRRPILRRPIFPFAMHPGKLETSDLAHCRAMIDRYTGRIPPVYSPAGAKLLEVPAYAVFEFTQQNFGLSYFKIKIRFENFQAS